MAASNEAHIWGVMAASGEGKGVWVKQQLAALRPARFVAWDPKDEYGEFAPRLERTLEGVRLAMLQAGRGRLAVRYRVKPGTSPKQRRREFEGLCMLVQAWGQCTFVAEELSQVTTPSWAPAAWQDMTTGGRHESVHIIGVAQNPALIDKTFLSNCTLIHVGPLREYRHRQAVARSMDVPIEDITELTQFHWIERDHKSRTLRKGATFPPGFTATARPASRTASGPRLSGQADGAAVAMGASQSLSPLRSKTQ